MNTTIGSGVQTNAFTGNMAITSRNYYVTRFVSPLIYQTSIAANTWVYAFAHRQTATGCNYPVSGNNAAVRVNIYVWKPSNGTKYGTILDGNTAATVDEGAANATIGHLVNATGSAVSSLTSGDAVIIIEAWFVITSGVATSQTLTYYYDGTTTFTENASGLTQPASYLETPENLTLTAPQNIERTAADTLTLTESTARVKGKPRTAADTTTLTESTARLTTKQRASSETMTLGETITRVKAPSKTSADTITLSETTGRMTEKIRTASDTIAPSDSVARQVTGGGGGGIERSLSDSIGISDSGTRQTNKWRRIG
jgi:hypothetical protein